MTSLCHRQKTWTSGSQWKRKSKWKNVSVFFRVWEPIIGLSILGEGGIFTCDVKLWIMEKLSEIWMHTMPKIHLDVIRWKTRRRHKDRSDIDANLLHPSCNIAKGKNREEPKSTVPKLSKLLVCDHRKESSVWRQCFQEKLQYVEENIMYIYKGYKLQWNERKKKKETKKMLRKFSLVYCADCIQQILWE